MDNPDCSPSLIARLKAFNRRTDEWTKKHQKEFIILISSMIAYGTVLLILSDGSFTKQTVVMGVQLLNTLGFFLAVIALLKKSKS
jgi:hypothetical protein